MERRLEMDDFIVSKTDLKGNITYANRIFIDLSEYSEEELLGKPHSILRHPEMPRTIFKLLWERIKAKEEIFAFVLNRTKEDNHYWVYANVTPSLDERGNIVGYYSVRRKPNPKALERIKPLYRKISLAERSGGVKAGRKSLDEFMNEQGAEYDEYIIHIQE